MSRKTVDKNQLIFYKIRFKLVKKISKHLHFCVECFQCY